MIGGGVGPGVTPPQQPGDRLTGPAGLIIDQRHQRVKPEPALDVAAANSFFEGAVTNVASRSTISGASMLRRMIRDRSPRPLGVPSIWGDTR